VCPSPDPLDSVEAFMRAPHFVFRGLVRDLFVRRDRGESTMQYGVASVAVLEVFFGPHLQSVDIAIDSDGDVCWHARLAEDREHLFLLNELPLGSRATAADAFDATPDVLGRARRAREQLAQRKER
jgi:hypothetical protein